MGTLCVTVSCTHEEKSTLQTSVFAALTVNLTPSLTGYQHDHRTEHLDFGPTYLNCSEHPAYISSQDYHHPR